VAERFHIHTEEVEPGVFELSLEHQEGDRRLLGTRTRAAAVPSSAECRICQPEADSVDSRNPGPTDPSVG
jgi:hypothetical protein